MKDFKFVCAMGLDLVQVLHELEMAIKKDFEKKDAKVGAISCLTGMSQPSIQYPNGSPVVCLVAVVEFNTEVVVQEIVPVLLPIKE